MASQAGGLGQSPPALGERSLLEQHNHSHNWAELEIAGAEYAILMRIVKLFRA